MASLFSSTGVVPLLLSKWATGWPVLTFLFAKSLYSLFVFQDVEKEKELRTHLTHEEIRQKVEQYNADSRDHFKMTLVS